MTGRGSRVTYASPSLLRELGWSTADLKSDRVPWKRVLPFPLPPRPDRTTLYSGRLRAWGRKAGNDPLWLPTIVSTFETDDESWACLCPPVEAPNGRFGELLAKAPVLVWHADGQGQRRYFDVGPLRSFGLLTESGARAEWRDRVHPDDLARLDSNHARALATRSGYEQELRLERLEGGYLWMLDKIAAVEMPDGSFAGHVGACFDIHERKLEAQALSHRAMHDALTGLVNREFLVESLRRALDRTARSGQHLALLFIDLDGFKAVNDDHGHAVGDEVLVAVARRVLAVVRPQDVVARLGGDEFVVLVDEISGEPEARSIAGRVARGLEEPIDTTVGALPIRGSCGLSVARPGSDRTPAELLAEADHAMYRAKQSAEDPDRVRSGLAGPISDPGPDTEQVVVQPRRRAQLECELEPAIRAGQVRPHFQPIVSLDSGAVTGFEALARWEHPEFGLLAAAEFIELVRGRPLALALHARMLDGALEALARWRKRGAREVSVHVNLTGELLCDEGTAQIARALKRHGVPAGALVVEVSEVAIGRRIGDAVRVIQDLAQLGVRVAVDDFGRGRTPLAGIARLALAELKIDRGFVRRFGAESDATAIVRGATGLARAMDLAVTAPGVEESASLAGLRDAGCANAQGFAISAPLPFEAAEAFLFR